MIQSNCSMIFLEKRKEKKRKRIQKPSSKGSLSKLQLDILFPNVRKKQYFVFILKTLRACYIDLNVILTFWRRLLIIKVHVRMRTGIVQNKMFVLDIRPTMNGIRIAPMQMPPFKMPPISPISVAEAST